MKLKKPIVIVAIGLVTLVGWLCINPPGRFGICTFACITYSGIPLPLFDLQVRSDGKTRKVDKTHDLKLEHVEWLLESKPEVLIIATGWDGRAKPSKAVTDLQDCEITILKTGDAVKLYNKLKREKKKVSIHVHATC